MRTSMTTKRRGISEVLATVMIIAITLVAATALASFVFSTFRANSTPAQLSIPSGSVQCFESSTSGGSITPPGGSPVTIPPGDCGMVVKNSGAQAGLVVDVGPGTTFTFEQCNNIAETSCEVPADSSSVVVVMYSPTLSGDVTGYLGQSYGPVLFFTTSIP